MRKSGHKRCRRWSLRAWKRRGAKLRRWPPQHFAPIQRRPAQFDQGRFRGQGKEVCQTGQQICRCVAFDINAGGDVSKDLSKLIYRLVHRQTDSVLAPLPADGVDEHDAALRFEHRMHTAEEIRRMRSAPQPAWIRCQVNLTLPAPEGDSRRQTQRADIL